MKTIIIPTDFSPAANNALQYALHMGVEINASILLFHVYQIPVAISDVPVVLASADELKKNAGEQLEQVRKQIDPAILSKIKVYTETVLGNTVDELEELCKRIKPFAVAMGAHGSSGMERILFGSTTLTAIRHLTWPVIIVPPETGYKSIKKIGFACDFKKVVKTTPTLVIKDVVNTFNAELLILNVDYENRHFKSETPQESLLLHTLLEDLNPSYHFINHPGIEDGINEFTEKNNLDLIITIPKKHRLLDGFFRKNATRQLVFHSHVPIMCVHE